MKHARDDYNEAIVDRRRPGMESVDAKIITIPGTPIPEDEPVFLLRAQDRFAPSAVKYYAHMLEATARGPEDMSLAALCRLQAKRMDEWPVKKDYPDTPGINAPQGVSIPEERYPAPDTPGQPNSGQAHPGLGFPKGDELPDPVPGPHPIEGGDAPGEVTEKAADDLG